MGQIYFNCLLVYFLNLVETFVEVEFGGLNVWYGVQVSVESVVRLGVGCLVDCVAQLDY